MWFESTRGSQPIISAYENKMEGEKHSTLTQIQIDALREVSNIGAGSAVTALSQFLGKSVEMEPTAEVIFNTTEDFRSIFGGIPMISVASSQIPEKISGHLLIIFEQENTLAVAKLLLGGVAIEDTEITNELGVSAIKEVCGVMFGAYVAAMGNMTSMSLMITPPAFDSGASQKVFEALEVRESVAQEQITICFETSFRIRAESDVPGYMLFVPSPVSLNTLLKILGVMKI